MNNNTCPIRTPLGISIIIGTALLVVGFYALNNYIYQEKQGVDTVVEPYRATLSGEYVCLPHKDTTGPQTDECAFGLLIDAGEYYAIDFNLMSQSLQDLTVGDRITATGVMTPIELLSTSQWQQYPIEGVLSVTDSLQILN